MPAQMPTVAGDSHGVRAVQVHKSISALAYAIRGGHTGCTRPVTETGLRGVAQSGQQVSDVTAEDGSDAQKVAVSRVASAALNALIRIA